MDNIVEFFEDFFFWDVELLKCIIENIFYYYFVC